MVSSIFVPAGFCQLVTVFMQIAMPLLVRQLLTVLSNNPGQNVVRQGMPYAVGIFLTVFVNGLATHRHRHLAMKSGVLMRAAVVEILYEQVLRLTPKGRTGLTSGQVANLVAVDTQKVRYDTIQYEAELGRQAALVRSTVCHFTHSSTRVVCVGSFLK